MNEQTKTIIDRARALGDNTAQGPWRVGTITEDGNPDPVQIFVVDADRDQVASVEVYADAELIAFAVNNLGALCDALEAAERRAEEAEARVADLESVRIEQAAKLRRHLDEIAELSALHSVAEARERRLERDLLAIWATVRPGNPAPLTERDVLHAVEDVQSEAVSLRSIITDCAAAIGNGSSCTSHASVEFMAMIPAEIRAEVAALRDRAGIAEGREAAAKANAEQMAGWLDARNAGLVQMARERDELREKLAAAEAKAARLEARKVAMCLCVDYRIHCKGGDPQYCQSGHDHETVGPREKCKKCHGSGAVIVDGAAQEGGVE